MPYLGIAVVVLTVLVSQAETRGSTANQAATKDTEPLLLIGCLQSDKAAGVEDGYVLVDARPPEASGSTPQPSSGASATGKQSSADRTPPADDPGQVTAGTTGTVPRPEGAEATPLRRYRLDATGVDLRGHTGHTVEVRGSLKPTTSTPPGEPAPREGSGSATAEPTSEMREAVIGVTAVRRVSTGCPQ